MERITAEPFFVGTPHNKENAEWVADLFRDWGYDTEIVEYQVLFPKPRIWPPLLATAAVKRRPSRTVR